MQPIPRLTPLQGGLGNATREYRENGGLAIYDTCPRTCGGADLTMAASAVMNGAHIWLPAGFTFTKFAMQTGSVGTTTPANWWFALYDPSGNLVCSTADQLTAALAANTTVDLVIGRDSAGAALASYTTLVAGDFVVAFMMTAATPPKIRGASLGSGALAAGLVAGQKQLAATSGSALAGTPPATWAAPANAASMPYIVLH